MVTSLSLIRTRVHTSVVATAKRWPGPMESDLALPIAVVESERRCTCGRSPVVGVCLRVEDLLVAAKVEASAGPPVGASPRARCP